MKMARSGKRSAFASISSLTISMYRDRSVPSSRLPFLAAVEGSMVTRMASKKAFQVQGRGLVTQDMIPYLAKAFEESLSEDLRDNQRVKL